MPPPDNLADLRAQLRRLRDERTVEELEDAAARLLSFRFLSEVEYLTESRGMTRRALAEAVGTTPSYITQLYRGDRLLNLTMVARFERVFGIEFHIKAVAPARPAPTPEAHPVLLRKLPAALRGESFAQAQRQAGGEVLAFAFTAREAAMADLIA